MSFRICLIGCGGMAEAGHGPVLLNYASGNRYVEMSACCDISAERAQAFAARFGFVRYFTGIDAMLDAVQPHAALLAVPMELTAELAVKILCRGVPLLTEKPPGATVQQGRAIAAAAREAGVPVSAAFNRRSMPLVKALMDQIAQLGGGIDSISIEMRRVCRDEPDFSMTAIHDIDLARHLAGSDYQDAAFLYHVHGQSVPAADTTMQACCESGALISLGFFPMAGVVSEQVTVRLPGHTLVAELPVYGSPDVPGRIIHYSGNKVCAVITGGDCDPAVANGFLDQAAGFFDAVRRGVTPPHSVEGSLQSLEVACCMSQRLAEYRKEKQG